MNRRYRIDESSIESLAKKIGQNIHYVYVKQLQYT